jgi:hypothetical protein
MNKYFISLLFMLVSSIAFAHEMTPTYPKLKLSAYNGLLITEMEVFNKRDDVEYYEIAVFDKDWNPVPFVSSYKVMKVEYLSRVKFDVYIRKTDRSKAEYICSRSKLRNGGRPSISSMICSRFK